MARADQDPLVAATVELTISVVVGSDPIRGSARTAGGEHCEFWGWLDLAEIVQQLVDGDRGVADALHAPSVPEGAPLR
jgi:hypothetical protein